MPGPTPNILYIHSHDTGRYVQPYGHAVPTPHIQRLAEQGVLFRQAFCGAPTCSPSRAALLTGQSPHSSGMLGLAQPGYDFKLNDYGQHLIHTLRDARGYHSALSGVQHVASEPETIGYDRILYRRTFGAEGKARKQSKTAADDVRFLDESETVAAAVRFLNGSPPEPFFLNVGFQSTHRSFPDAGPGEDPRYTMPPAPLPDTPETRRDMADFKASARMLDAGIGAVLEALDASGLADNTLVVCTTDHGIPFPDMKCNLTDHGIGVMLIMRGPKPFSGGRIYDSMVSQIDLFPTICDLLEIEPPGWLQGRSIMPVVRGEVEEVNDEVFSEVTFHAVYEPQRAVRTRRWNYIRRYGEHRNAENIANNDDGPSTSVWVRHDWASRAVPDEELYNLAFDPVERHNLAGDPALAAVLQEMRGRLDRWMARTGDPLLHGPVPAPADGSPNDPQ